MIEELRKDIEQFQGAMEDFYNLVPEDIEQFQGAMEDFYNLVPEI